MSDAARAFGKDDVFTTLEDARARAETLRQQKIDKLQKKLQRVQAMKF